MISITIESRLENSGPAEQCSIQGRARNRVNQLDLLLARSWPIVYSPRSGNSYKSIWSVEITIVLASTSEKRTDQVFQRCRQGRKFDFDLLERKRCRWRLRFQSRRSRNCNFRLFNKSINYFNSDKSRVFTSAIFLFLLRNFHFSIVFFFVFREMAADVQTKW